MWLLVTVVSLTIPIMIFVFRYSAAFSPKQNATIGLANMVVVVSVSYLILTKWISKIR
jgi:hypothetical protein